MKEVADEETQKKLAGYICNRLEYDIEDICYYNKGDLKCFFDITLNNIFTKNDAENNNNPAYSFKTKNLVQAAGNIDQKILD